MWVIRAENGGKRRRTRRRRKVWQDSRLGITWDEIVIEAWSSKSPPPSKLPKTPQNVISTMKLSMTTVFVYSKSQGRGSWNYTCSAVDRHWVTNTMVMDNFIVMITSPLILNVVGSAGADSTPAGVLLRVRDLESRLAFHSEQQPRESKRHTQYP